MRKQGNGGGSALFMPLVAQSELEYPVLGWLAVARRLLADARKLSDVWRLGSTLAARRA